jgi:hypothetical protein
MKNRVTLNGVNALTMRSDHSVGAGETMLFAAAPTAVDGRDEPSS